MADDQEQNAQAESAPEDQKRHQPVKVDLPDGGSVEVSYSPPVKVEPQAQEQSQDQGQAQKDAPEPAPEQ